MTGQLRCRVVNGEGTVVVHPLGELSRKTAPELRSVMTKALAESPIAIILDLAEMTVADTSCLSIFLAIAQEASIEPSTPIALCHASEMAADGLSAIGLDRLLTVCGTPAEAHEWARLNAAASRVSKSFLPTVESGSRARHLVATTCAMWGVPDEVTECLQVIVTELVGNVVRHAGTPMEVVLRRSGQRIHVAVLDQDPRLAQMRERGDADAVGGQGLVIVEAFATSWGCHPTAKGKSTWATLTYPSRSSRSGSPPA